MWRFLPTLLNCLLGLLLLVQSAYGQQATGTPGPEGGTRVVYVPSVESRMFPTFGAGIGVPYGIIGGRFGLGIDAVSFDLGAGIVPLAWEPAGSAGASLYFTNRLATVRPKATIAVSNVAGMILLLEQSSLDVLESKTYAGVALYGGIDWRLGKTSPLCLDINVGATFPFDGIDQMKKDLDDILEELRGDGYLIEDVTEPRNGPVISIGLAYAPGRSLRANLP